MSLTEIKPSRSFKDPLFNFNGLNALELSVQFGLDALYLAILDSKSKTFVAVKEFIFEGVYSPFQVKDEFERIIDTEPLFKLNYTRKLVGVIDRNSVLIPEALFDKDKTTDYLKFAQDLPVDHEVFDDELINAKARNVYALPSYLVQSIQDKVPGALLHHFSSPLIEGLILKLKRTEGQKIVLHIQYSHFEMLYFLDGALNFNNTFSYTTAEDFIYYVLFVMEQLGLNTDKIEVMIYGEIEDHSGTFELLRQYVRNVQFGKRNDLIQYSDILDAVPNHFYFNLFHQHMCV